MNAQEQVPPAEVFPALAVLLHRISRATAQQLDALAAAWEASRPVDGTGAQAEALTVAGYAATLAGRSALWEQTWDKAWNAARERVAHSARDARQAVGWDGARAACRDAALAVLMRDKILPARFDTLTAPWVQVMGATWDETDAP